jgi:lactobin A/cerein 7B family class IIb bacteriocin
MTNLNNELSFDELAAVNGGTWMDTAIAVAAAGAAITGINSVLTKAVDSIPPAPCHVSF